MKQYQFSLKDESMKELPEYGRRNYQQKTKHPLSIPVPKKYLSLFIDGKIYNEDEFEINENHRYADGFEKGGSFMDKIAIPKQKVDDIDCIEIATDLYKEMQDININSSKGQSILMEYSLLISKLQKHYTITRKNNQ